MRREIEIVLRGAKSMAEAEKAGQAEHSLSDINPVVVFFFFFFNRRPTLTGHISDSSDCWRKTERDGKDSSVIHFRYCIHSLCSTWQNKGKETFWCWLPSPLIYTS